MCYSINKKKLGCQQGVTLIELIVSMVIISISLAGILTVMNFTTSHSADPMIQQQAMVIAEAYMEEITLQRYENPVGGYSGTSRNLFDDVDDYNNLSDIGARDQNENPMSGLDQYDVSVAVATPATIGPVASTELAKQITVRVQYGTMVDLQLVGYRTDYD